MTALHQVFSNDIRAAEDCLSIARTGDEILLVGEGVRILEQPDSMARFAGYALFATTADVAEREGESVAAAQGVRLLNDNDWVLKVTHHREILSWI